MASLALALISLSALVAGAKAECCGTTTIVYTLPDSVGSCGRQIPHGLRGADGLCRIDVCNDGQWHEGTYCGVGPCNIFGCNCDGGCFGDNQDDAYGKFMEQHGHHVKQARVV